MFGIEVTLGKAFGRCCPAMEVTLGGGASGWPFTTVVEGGPGNCALAGRATTAVSKNTTRKSLTACAIDRSRVPMAPPVYSNPLDARKFFIDSGTIAPGN